MSAHDTLSREQAALAVACMLALVGLGFWAGALGSVLALNAAATLVYLGNLAYNTAWFRAVLHSPPLIRVSDEEARSVAHQALPSYTVLIPAFHEAEVLPALVAALKALEYPSDLLEVKLLLEEDDEETAAAAAALALPPNFEVVRVPAGGPRTKPKACNFGLLRSSGELVTIFDAEDRPDPLQLRRAVVAFGLVPADVACLQSKLHYHNARQNLITRLFQAEYVTWFAQLLPALVSMGAPIPLGGTSMHVRRRVLEEVGAWDPHNVTEDADLGIRLRRAGYQTRLLDSITYEEANSDFVNWARQRSRWYKGYLQTWLVHMRSPLRLRRELGWRGFAGFNMLLLGTPLLALVNPVFWALTLLWIAGKPLFVQLMFPSWIYYAGMLCMVAGNFVAVYRMLVSLRAAGYPELMPWLVLLPLYWLMMAVAAVRAFAQLLVAPFHWDKTVHGLDRVPEAVEA